MRDTVAFEVGQIVRYTHPSGTTSDAIVQAECDDDGLIRITFQAGRFAVMRYVKPETLSIPR